MRRAKLAGVPAYNGRPQRDALGLFLLVLSQSGHLREQIRASLEQPSPVSLGDGVGYNKPAAPPAIGFLVSVLECFYACAIIRFEMRIRHSNMHILYVPGAMGI
jgi:hypothetical protein